jgi:signal transduction histidine kinase
MGGGGIPRARSHPDRLRRGSDRVRDERPGLTADAERAQFLAVVSHEMRTPLTSIISFSELLRGEAAGLTPEGLRFLGIIERNADRLLRLIDDLLMLNRIEAGGLPLELTEVSLPDLAAEAVKSATPVAAKSGVTVHLDAGEGPRVLADPRRLTQVLDNLIGNAVKFSHVDGLVRVRLRYLRGTWRIDVSDTGIGIPADEAARLFGPFVRGSNARLAGLPGTGLGLAIVESLVEMHGGHLKVESVLDEGTTFSVFLPVRTTATAPVFNEAKRPLEQGE